MTMTCNINKIALDCPLETEYQYILYSNMFERTNKGTGTKFNKISVMPVTSFVEVQAVYYLVHIQSGDYIGQMR